MNNLKTFRKICLGALGFFLLVGFTGQEKFVELEGYLNGRASHSFRRQDRNIVGVLEKGTRGEILNRKKLRSGNYGLLIKTLSGPHKGQNFWVYYNINNPDLALYDSAPESWQGMQTADSVEAAQGTETVRETPAIADPEKPVDTGVQASAPVGPQQASVADTINTIEESNEAVGLVTSPRPRARAECRECSIDGAEKKATKVVIGKPTKKMEKSCSDLMDSKGNLGPVGQDIYSIMSEKKYKKVYTRSNAMGKFCPEFNSLTKEQKLMAWTWFWTALANEESSCRLKAVHGTTYRDRNGALKTLNPTEGYGYWAMERDKNLRQDRGSACYNIKTAEGQARCSIDIMLKTTLNQGQSASSDPSSYWGPVRRSSSQMMPHMRRFKLCF